MEIIIEIVGELLIQTIGEILFEAGFYSVLEIRKKRTKRNPIVAAIGYLITGAILGGLSLIFFPKSLISPEFKTLNLIFTPVIAGIAMSPLFLWCPDRGSQMRRTKGDFFGRIVLQHEVQALRFLF